MSTVIDEKVVQMRFDNSDFEKNVDKSMSTLDKLKQKIKGTSDPNAFNELSDAGKKIDLSRIEDSLSKISFRSSALYDQWKKIVDNVVSGVKKLANTAMSSVTDGGLSRAMNIEAAKFKIEGLGISWEDVSDSIQKGVRDTAYSLDASATACAQLAASGVELGDKMTGSLRAISGVAAMTGRSYEDISDIFIKAAGKGKLTGEELTRLSERGINAAATLGEALGKTESEIRDMASKGKISFEDFAKAMENAYADSAFKANETISGVTANIKSAFARIGADFYSPIIENGGPLVTFLNKVREKVNDLKTALSPLAETVGKIVGDLISKAGDLLDVLDFSGLQKSNEKIFKTMNGGYTELVKLIDNAGVKQSDFELMVKEVAKAHGIAIDEMIEKEGSFEDTLKNGWLTNEIFDDTIQNFIEDLGGLSDATDKSTKSLGTYEQVVKDVIRGVYGNGADRQKKLIEAGYDYKTVQDLVNKTLAGQIVEYEKLSDAQLKNMGYSNDQIKALRMLQIQANASNTTVSNLLETYQKPTGRELVFQSISNIVEGLRQRLELIKEAFRSIFPKKDTNLYNTLENFNKLSESFKMSDERAASFKKTFEAIFAIFDIFAQVISAVIKGIGTLVGALFKVVDVGGSVGTTFRDLIINFDKFLKSNNLIGKSIQALANALAFIILKIKAVISALINFFREVAKLPIVQELGEAIRYKLGQGIEYAGDKLSTFIKYMKAFKESISQYLHIDLSKGLIENLRNLHLDDIKKPFQTIGNAFKNLKDKILNNEFFNLGDKLKAFKEKMVSIFGGLRDFLEGIDWSKVKGIATFAGSMAMFLSGAKILFNIGNLLNVLGKGIGGLMTSISGFFGAGKKMFESVTDLVKSYKRIITLKAYSSILIQIAGSIVILCGALALMTLLDQGRLREAAITMAIVASGVVVLAVTLGVIAKSGLGEACEKLAAGLLMFSVALGILLLCLSKLEKLDASWKSIWQLVAIMGALLVVATLLSKGNKIIAKDQKMITTSAGLLGFVISLNLMISALKNIAGESPRTILKGLALMVPIVVLLSVIGVLCRNIKAGAGLSMIAFVLSLVLFDKALNYIVNNGVDLKAVKEHFLELIIIIGLMAALAKAARLAGEHAASAGIGLLLMSGALAILILEVKALADISKEDLIKGEAALAGLVAMVAALMLFSKYTEKANLKSLTKLIVLLTVVFVELMILSNFDWKGLVAAGVGMAAVIISIGYAMKCMNSLMNSDAYIKIGTLIVVLGLLASAAYAMKYLADKDWKSIAAAGVGLGIAMYALSKSLGIIAGIGKDKFDKDKLKAMVAVSVPILALGVALSLISHFNWKQIAAAGVAMGIALLALGKSLTFISEMKEIKNTNEDIILTTLSLVIPLGIALSLMANNDWKGIMSASVAMGVAMMALAGALYVIGTIDEKGLNKEKIYAILAMSVPIASIGVSLSLIAKNNWKQIGMAAVAMGACMFSLVGALKVLGKTDGRTFGKNKLKALAASILPILGLGASLALIARYDWTSIAAAGTAMSACLLVLVYSLNQLENFKMSGKDMLSVFGATVAMLLPITASLFVLAGYDWQGLLAAAGAISLAMLALTVALGIMSKINVNLEAAGAIALASVAFLTIGAALWLVADIGWDGLLPGLEAIGIALLELATLSAILGYVGPVCVAGAAYLDGIVLLFGGLAGILGLVNEWTEGGLAETIMSGAEVMEGIGAAIGKLIGGLVGGIGAALMDTIGPALPAFGQNLTDFMTNVQGFIDGVKNVGMDVVTGAGELAAVILALTGAEVIKGIGDLVNWLVGGKSLAEIGTELSEFATNLGPFITAMSGVGSEAALAGKYLSEMIFNLTKNDIFSALTGWFTGDDSVEKFSTSLVGIAGGLVAYAAACQAAGGAFSSPDFMQSVEGARVLGELEEKLPKHGGLLQKWMGDNDLATFGSGLQTFAQAMVDYATTIGTTDFSRVEASASAATLLSNLEDGLPEHGGLLQEWMGDNDLAGFGVGLQSFGQAMVDYVNTIGDTDFSHVENSANAGKTLAELESNLPNHGGKLSEWLLGDSTTLDAWGVQLMSFGTALINYSMKVANLNTGAIQKSADAGSMLSSLESGLESTGGAAGILFGDADLGEFGERLKTLGEGFKDYNTEITGIDWDNMQKAADAGYELRNLGNLVADNIDDKLKALGKGAESFGEGLSKAAGFDTALISSKIVTVANMINIGLTTIFNGISTKFANQQQVAKTNADKYTEAYLNTFKNKKREITNACETFLSYIVSAMQKGPAKAKELGHDLADGYILGIKDRVKKLKTEVEKFVKEGALVTIQKTQDSHSPAWLTRLLGRDGGEGYLLGFADKIPKLKDTVSNYVSSGMDILKSGTEDGIEGILKSLGLGTDGMEEFTKLMTGNTQDIANATEKMEKITSAKFALLAESIFDNAQATAKSADKVEKNLANITKAYTDYQDSLKDTISGSIDIFKAFDKKTELTGDTLLENMRSQVNGIQDWAIKIKELSTKGIDDGILQKLASMGPEGYEYVNAFTQMTADQLKEASSLFQTSLTLPDLVTQDVMNSLADNGMWLVKGLANGINKNLDIVKDAGGNMGTSAIDGEAETTKTNSPSRVMIEQGMWLDKGLALGITDNCRLITDAMGGVALVALNRAKREFSTNKYKQVGIYITEGLRQGIVAGSSSVLAEAEKLANEVAEIIERALEIHSPSRRMIQDGMYIDEGLAIGIRRYSKVATMAAEDMANETLNGFNEQTKRLSDVIDWGMDLNPIITPKLDLSDIKAGTDRINTMMNQAKIGVSGDFQNGDGTGGTVGNNISFVQNNYSPEALSRIDIYRDTRNQLSMLKGLVH